VHPPRRDQLGEADVDVRWLRQLEHRATGVLAHEWFHFLDTARGTRSLHEEELKADAFAGRLLARLKFPAQHFAELLREYPQSRTHPGGELRARTMLSAHLEEQGKVGGVSPAN
jgi:hypothetical protein